MPTHSGGLILAARHKVGPVRRELQIGHDVAMRVLVVRHFFARFGIPQRDFAGFVPRQDVASVERKGHHGRFGTDGVEEIEGIR